MTFIEINPNQTCLTPQNCGGIHLVGRLNSQVMRSYMVMTTLHTPSIPPQGLHMLFFTGKDSYQALLLLLSLTVHTCLSQQFYFFHFSFLILSLTLIQTSNTPECQSLDAEPQNTMTINDPYSNSTSWDQHNCK